MQQAPQDLLPALIASLAGQYPGMDTEMLEERMNIIRHKLKFFTEDQKPAVCLLGSATGDQYRDAYTEALVQLSGGRIWRPDAGTPEGPELLLIVYRGPLSKELEALPELLMQPQWAVSPAVQHNRIYLADGNRFLQGPGAGMADDAELLAEIIHPKQFIYGYNGDGWLQFEI